MSNIMEAQRQVHKTIEKAILELRKLQEHPCKDFISEKYSSAVCGVCFRDFGWWCPESENHICTYSEREDWCDHCGQPEERK